MNTHIKLVLLGSATISLGGCSQDINQKQARVTAAEVARVSKNITSEALILNNQSPTAIWTAAKHNRVLQTKIHRLHHALSARIGVASADEDASPLFGTLPDLISSDQGTNSASASVAASLPSAPAIASGTLPSNPGTASSASLDQSPVIGSSGSLPMAPSTGSASFSALPSLLATYSGGTSSVSEFGDAFCEMFDSLIDYVVRCAPDLDQEVTDSLNSNFGVATCKSAILPEIEKDLGSTVPAGLVNVMSCISTGFGSASCTNPEESLTSELSRCGLSM